MTAFHLDLGVVVDVRRACPPTRESWDWGHARGSLETMEKQNVSKKLVDARWPEGVGDQDRVRHDVDVRCVPAHSRDWANARGLLETDWRHDGIGVRQRGGWRNTC